MIPPPESPSTSPQAPLRLLYVEDNPADILLLKSAFELCNFHPELSVANDGVEALAYLRQEGPFKNVSRPDLILLDLNLPRKNGYEVLEEIRKDPSLNSVCVAIYSGSSDLRDREKSLRMGANFFFEKPKDLEEYFSIVEELKQIFQISLRTSPS